MNKILNINLGGFAFTIDDDAFEYLNLYLDSIRRRFSASEGRDEILADIEMRLGELVTAELGNRNIVMLPDVEAAVQIMGKPEDFGAEPIDNRRNMGGKKAKSGSFRTGKRLFRDEEDKVAAGVCSGLAAYFGINDPVWMRLIFVLLTFISAGFWGTAYIIMWALIPPARTAAERLSMRGEPINVDNIAREVEEGFERLGEKVNEFSNTAKKKSGVAGHNAANGLANVLNVIGSVFAFVVKFFAKFGLLILIILAVAFFISLVVGWIGSFWGIMAAAPYLSYFSPFSDGTTYLATTSIFFLLAIPAIGLALLFARLLMKFKIPKWVGATMGIVWAVNLAFAIILGAFTAQSFRQSRTLTQGVSLSGLNSDTLRVEYMTEPELSNYDHFFDGDGLRIIDDNLQITTSPDVKVKPSNRGDFECIVNVTARGSNSRDAMENAQQVMFKPVLVGNVLKIPNYISIPNGKKFRAQRMNLVILVPPGKFIVFGEEINNHTWNSEYARGEDYRISNYPNKPFRMTNDGLVCADCPNFGSSDYQDYSNYDNFILEGPFETEIRKGDRFKMNISDPSDALDIIRAGDKLTITAKDGSSSAKVKVLIETPVFTDLYANNSGNVTIRGFEEGRANITARGTSQIKGYFDSNYLSISQSGPCRIQLFGKGDELEADLSDAATLEAGAYRAERVRVDASNGSNANVHSNQRAKIKNDASSHVTIEGGGEKEIE